MKKIIILFSALVLLCLTSVSAEGLPLLTLNENETVYTFSVNANGLYSVCLFPASDDCVAQADLYQNNVLVLQGSDDIQSLMCRLTADTTYELRVSGSGKAYVEIARETLSRSFFSPLELADGENYDKLLAREGDAHWYELSCDNDSNVLLAGVPNDGGFSVEACLFDTNGRMLCASESVANAFAIDWHFEKGQKYLLRITSPDGKGLYTLLNLRGSKASKLYFAEDVLTVEGREDVLSAIECDSTLFFAVSSDTSVATVTPDGVIHGQSSGSATFIAYAFGGLTDVCTVNVANVEAEDVVIDCGVTSLCVGETFSLNAKVLPRNAVNNALIYVVTDETIATVDDNGLCTALDAGTVTFYAVTENGKFVAEHTVTVEPRLPRCRALLIGEQNYNTSIAATRPGTSYSVNGLKGLFENRSCNGIDYEVTTGLDLSRDEIIALIESTLSDTSTEDVSVIYLTCHGITACGQTLLLLCDGSMLSTVELAQTLRGLNGEVVLMLDCCHSGGIRSRQGESADIFSNVTNVTDAIQPLYTIGGSNLHIIMSAFANQESYRVTMGGDKATSSTAFVRAFCEAAGWDMDKSCDTSSRLGTLDELISATADDVSATVGKVDGYEQNVCSYPLGDTFKLFDTEE